MNEDVSLSVWLLASKHTPLHPLDWFQNGNSAEPRMTHSYSKWQKTPIGHTARQDSKVSVSQKIPMYTHACTCPEDRSYTN